MFDSLSFKIILYYEFKLTVFGATGWEATVQRRKKASEGTQGAITFNKLSHVFTTQ